MAATVEVYEGRPKRANSRQRWRWRLRSANQQIIATSHEAYTTRYGAVRAARTFLRSAATAGVVEV